MLEAGKVILVSGAIIVLGNIASFFQNVTPSSPGLSEWDFIKQIGLSSPALAALVVFIWLFFKSWNTREARDAVREAAREEQEAKREAERQRLEHERWTTLNSQLGETGARFSTTVQAFIDTVKSQGHKLDENTATMNKNHEKVMERLGDVLKKG